VEKHGGIEMIGLKKILIFYLSIFIINNAHAACTGSSPVWTCTPDYDSLNQLITYNSPGVVSNGDTIIVSSGNATWSSKLSIKKGIKLIGAGIGKTNVTLAGIGTGISPADNFEYINYSPTDKVINSTFRISGFTFDIQDTLGSPVAGDTYTIIQLQNNSTDLQSNIRIDHNRFYSSTSGISVAIENDGMKGVIDNNIIETVYIARHISGFGTGGSAWWGDKSWKWYVFFGAADNQMYFEDNTINTTRGYFSCQSGGQYSVRYNTITISPPYDVSSMFDQHGDQNSGNIWSCFGGEIYGNKFTNAGRDIKYDMRGGRFVVFGNKTNGTFRIITRNEYNVTTAPTGAPYSSSEVVDTYIWNNRETTNTLDVAYILTDVAWVNGLAENVNFWQQNLSYNGTTERGVYCGTTLPGNCTKGDGAWITTQPCDSVSDANVGKSPVIPISGTLYKCNSGGQWEAYYIPYTYPHPLTTAHDPPLRLRLVSPTK
jgi:hypothetical protein